MLDTLRAARGRAGRAERLEAALSDAADSPLAVARAAAEVAGLAAEVARNRQPAPARRRHLGCRLAEAACAAAARLVEINLTGRPEDPRREEAAELPQRALQARLAALSPERDV